MTNNGSNMVLSVLLRAVDGISNPIRRVQQRLGQFRRQAESIGRRIGFERLSKSITTAGNATKELYQQSRRVARRLVLIGTIGAASMFATANATAQLGTQTANVADMLGINVEVLQAYRYAAEQAGLGAGNFDLALRRMLRRSAEAAQGNGAAADAIKELNLSAEAMQMRTPEQQLALVADALQRVENQSDRLRLAFNLFDTDGAMMLNMLRDGSAGLAEMADQAYRFGHIMSEDDVRRSEQFTATLLDMRKTMQGVRNTVGLALMPVFNEWMGQLTELIIKYQPQIQAWATTFAQELPARLQSIQAQVLQLTETLSPFISRGMELVERFGAVNSAAAILAVLIGAPLIIPIIKTTAAFAHLGYALTRTAFSLLSLGIRAIPSAARGLQSLAGRAIPAVLKGLRALSIVARVNPIGLIVTAVVGGALLIRKYWEPISAFFTGVWTGIKAGLQPVSGIFNDVRNRLSALYELLGPVGTMLSWLGERFSDLVRWVGNLFTPVNASQESLERATSAGERFGHIIGTVLTGAIQVLLLPFKALGFVIDTTVALFERAKDIFNWSPLEQIRSGIEATTSWLSNIDWSAHGRALMTTLANGIRSAATAPYRAVSGALERARNLLPFSDAREGPLSRLTASGQAIPTTLAEGIARADSAPANALQGVLRNVRSLFDMSGSFNQTPGSSAVPEHSDPDLNDAATGYTWQRAFSDVSNLFNTQSTASQLTGSQNANSSSATPAVSPVVIQPQSQAGMHIDRVIFSPTVTVQAGNNASADDIAATVERLMERWRNRELWLSIQGVQEAGV